MLVRARPPHRRSSCVLVLVVGLAILAAATPATAENGFHPLDSTLEFMNLKAQPGAMPDFVQQSHETTKGDDYMPVGVKPSDRALKIKTPAEVKAATASLDAARAAQLAGKRPKPVAATAPGKLDPRKTATSR